MHVLVGSPRDAVCFQEGSVALRVGGRSSNDMGRHHRFGTGFGGMLVGPSFRVGSVGSGLTLARDAPEPLRGQDDPLYSLILLLLYSTPQSITVNYSKQQPIASMFYTSQSL